MNGYKTTKNPFDEEEEFDFKFGNRGVSYSKGPEEELRQLKERYGQVENESLQSTERALRSIHETREIGVKTAEELVRQGEKLQNIDQKLDEVDQTLTATQKNINQIKSIFGGLKNRFMRSSKETSSMPNSASAGNLIGSQRPTAQQQSKADFVPITGSDREKEMFKNLEEMSSGLSHITQLARDMSTELDRQNNTIDRIGVKTDRTKTKIDVQNTQMKKIR